VDARQVGIEGVSRYGKAAIVAIAYDRRFAIGFIGFSGEGGASLYRRNWGELVENVAAANEYHWMAGNFLKYAMDGWTPRACFWQRLEPDKCTRSWARRIWEPPSFRR